MKQIAAIILLSLLLYNAFGYYLLFAYEREQERVTFLENIPDSNFQVRKFNVAVYTSVANTEFEYLNEELIIQGKSYHIVKKRIQNDSLELYYLQDFRQDELRKNLNDIVESQTLNNSSTTETPVKQMLKSFLKDYISDDLYILVDCCPKMKILESNKIPVAPNLALTSAYLSYSSPPPEVA